MWILIAQEKVGSEATGSTDGWDGKRERDRKRKCISETGSRLMALTSLPWEIRGEMVLTRFQDRKKKVGGGEGCKKRWRQRARQAETEGPTWRQQTN